MRDKPSAFAKATADKPVFLSWALFSSLRAAEAAHRSLGGGGPLNTSIGCATAGKPFSRGPRRSHPRLRDRLFM